MCQVLDVSRNGYYNWLKDRQIIRRERKQMILVAILRIFNKSGKTYGSPRIAVELNTSGYKVSEPYVAKIMKENGIKSILRKKYVITTESDHQYPLSKNILDRQFETNELGRKWVSDITYIRVKDSWSYLTTIIDLADRKVIGWHISDNMTTNDTVIAAWDKAIFNRKIHPKGLIFHSDRGVQYASNAFRNILNDNKLITQSMSRKGNCWDNAVAESFFKTIKHEMINHKKFSYKAELNRAIFRYIEGWYNINRLHSAIGYKSPANKEKELLNIINKAA